MSRRVCFFPSENEKLDTTRITSSSTCVSLGWLRTNVWVNGHLSFTRFPFSVRWFCFSEKWLQWLKWYARQIWIAWGTIVRYHVTKTLLMCFSRLFLCDKLFRKYFSLAKLSFQAFALLLYALTVHCAFVCVWRNWQSVWIGRAKKMVWI